MGRVFSAVDRLALFAESARVPTELANSIHRGLSVKTRRILYRQEDDGVPMIHVSSEKKPLRKPLLGTGLDS
jgi:hypothetical protein